MKIYSRKDDSKEEKKEAEDNLKKVFLLLAILLSGNEEFKEIAKPYITDSNVKFTFEELSKNEDLKPLFDKTKVLLHQSKTLQSIVKEADESGKQIDEKAVTKEIAIIAKKDVKFVRIVTAGDDEVCGHCREWQGKVVSLNKTEGYDSVQDFINSSGLHPNCRCSLQEVSVSEIQRKPPNPKVMNDFVPMNIVF